jgi:acyl-CoA synthetase (NDP forming)
MVSETQGLSPILRPKSIAVIGASRSPATIGYQVLANLVQHGFKGPVYPINPKASAIHSMRAYRSIAEIGEPVDLGVVVVPKQLVPQVISECGEAGVKGVVVISAGFKETGPDGAERERQLLDLVRSYGMRMVGPNCMGVINADPDVSMNATFAPVMPPFGPAGFVSQSGAMGLSVLDYAREYGIGIAQFISVGNKADVSGNDLLLEWENDPSIQTILMYVENFGNPRRFLEIAKRVTRNKPIIARLRLTPARLPRATRPSTPCWRRREFCVRDRWRSYSTSRWLLVLRSRSRGDGALLSSRMQEVREFSRLTHWTRRGWTW